jgi:acyl-CoA thioester hydrolase
MGATLQGDLNMSDFSQSITVRWADLDPNGHVRHSVYYDWGALARIAYLEQHGVGLRWMTENTMGPVLFREEARFLREVRMGDDLSIDFKVAGLSDDGRKFRIRHTVVRGGTEVVATLEVDGAWLDLRARKIRVPPDRLTEALGELPRTDDFAPLLSGQRG